MTKRTSTAVTDPDAREKLRIAKALLGGYAAVSVLTLLAIAALSGDPDLVTGPVWVRGTILAAASLITFALGVSMARGSRSAYRRVRIIALAQVAAIVVIESIPGSFPVWFKVENGVCGTLLAIVVLLTLARTVRAAFAAR
ncbi:hypothetical protein [Actinomadura decatromicini]|uniref:Uncharacterized protein n=1 Tax=Actinomadura decatromicini TaxID=2604572 RepID=A0A5D3FE74_9ACTN|nr:hypothetical protein [Actinomadura decatromicini]TYK46100.1 hypothetical protein FXF68_28290 [Actinomadura decatromicini]